MRYFAHQLHEVAGAHDLATAVGSDITRTLEAVHRHRAFDRVLGQLLACGQDDSHDPELLVVQERVDYVPLSGAPNGRMSMILPDEHDE
ncbi:hypothetical protein PG1C_09780 [Rugosibacter aromaticivorans]|uniref:Uncharacterized protein n=1 Tax=Rugosibacter aromaticivorans TaxID=1565605 RepID=A0A0C5J9P8_9PROT|nr:hypothetical protein [Rugosibacter aromaticivorans]AJP48645.1 hypothetical protein PG1C_09780 [Rugosibacter aromaticivorans]TBR13380.1 MAG: hypothetical protein EPO43_10795 [Rugosibacter sp.]